MTKRHDKTRADQSIAALIRVLHDDSDEHEPPETPVPEFVDLTAEERSALDDVATGFVDRLVSGHWPLERLTYARWHSDRKTVCKILYELVAAYAGKAKALIRTLTRKVVDDVVAQKLNHIGRNLILTLLTRKVVENRWIVTCLVRSLLTVSDKADEFKLHQGDFQSCFLRIVYRETVAALRTHPIAGKSEPAALDPNILHRLPDETVANDEIVQIVDCTMECLEDDSRRARLQQWLLPEQVSPVGSADIDPSDADSSHRATQDVRTSTSRGTRGRGMLVLSRKRNESIVIDNNIVVTVLEVRGNKVRLGLEAPKERGIYRSEIHAAIRSKHESAPDDSPRISSLEI